jgi:hypothetical protein
MSFHAQKGRLCMAPYPPRPRTWLRRPQLGGTLHHGRSDDERRQSVYFAPANPTEEAHKMFRVWNVSYTSAKPPEIHQERVGCAA